MTWASLSGRLGSRLLLGRRLKITWRCSNSLSRARIIDHVDPVQFSIRLLIPPGSWIADLDETKPHLGPLDEAAFTFRWQHPNPEMDRLQKAVAALVEHDAENNVDPATTFFRIKALAHGEEPRLDVESLPPDRVRAPRMTESWFC